MSSTQSGHHGRHFWADGIRLSKNPPVVWVRVPPVDQGDSAGSVTYHAWGYAAATKEAKYAEVSVQSYESQIFITSLLFALPLTGNCRDALQTLTSTRQSSTLAAFLDALTRGGPNGLPRPIELHAHDPTRYVGDMLAWVHQTTASEHEFLEGLFGVKEKRRMVGALREAGGEEEGRVQECLDKDLEGLSRPLKVRLRLRTWIE